MTCLWSSFVCFEEDPAQQEWALAPSAPFYALLVRDTSLYRTCLAEAVLQIFIRSILTSRTKRDCQKQCVLSGGKCEARVEMNYSIDCRNGLRISAPSFIMTFDQMAAPGAVPASEL